VVLLRFVFDKVYSKPAYDFIFLAFDIFIIHLALKTLEFGTNHLA